jgi:hypothetical protein
LEIDVKVVCPVPVLEGTTSALAARPSSLSGRAIGILSNGKPNSMALLRTIAERLQNDYGVAATVEADKSIDGEGAGDPSPDVLLDRLSSGAIAVLVASGD